MSQNKSWIILDTDETEYIAPDGADTRKLRTNLNNALLLIITGKFTGDLKRFPNLRKLIIMPGAEIVNDYIALSCRHLTELINLSDYKKPGIRTRHTELHTIISKCWQSEFKNAKNLKFLKITNNQNDIDSDTFKNKTVLNKININCSVGSNAFENCKNLSSVILQKDVSSIGSSAFAGCGITHIHIPCSVNSKTFKGCQKLKHVVINQKAETLDLSAFEDCPSLEDVVILNSSIQIINSENINNFNIYIKGTVEDWNANNLAYDGMKCTVWFYSEIEPTRPGLYWHFDKFGNVKQWNTYNTELLQYRFVPDTSSYEVVGIGSYTNPVLHIPARYKGVPVTSINTNFRSYKNLKSVFISRNIVNIDRSAFNDCYELEKVEFDDETRCIIQKNTFKNTRINTIGTVYLPSTKNEHFALLTIYSDKVDPECKIIAEGAIKGRGSQVILPFFGYYYTGLGSSYATKGTLTDLCDYDKTGTYTLKPGKNITINDKNDILGSNFDYGTIKFDNTVTSSNDTCMITIDIEVLNHVFNNIDISGINNITGDGSNSYFTVYNNCWVDSLSQWCVLHQDNAELHLLKQKQYDENTEGFNIGKLIFKTTIGTEDETKRNKVTKIPDYTLFNYDKKTLNLNYNCLSEFGKQVLYGSTDLKKITTPALPWIRVYFNNTWYDERHLSGFWMNEENNFNACKEVQFITDITITGNGLTSNSLRQTQIETCTITGNCTTIPVGCFRHCKELEKMILSTELTSININAFHETPKIKFYNIEEPNNLYKNTYKELNSRFGYYNTQYYAFIFEKTGDSTMRLLQGSGNSAYNLTLPVPTGVTSMSFLPGALRLNCNNLTIPSEYNDLDPALNGTHYGILEYSELINVLSLGTEDNPINSTNYKMSKITLQRSKINNINIYCNSTNYAEEEWYQNKPWSANDLGYGSPTITISS